ncbi:hypothetical protein H6G64_30070 [Calothrix sp. FACHB-156]|nr:hypothetical protein [Calothrix sp. FACHB-156]
MNESTVIHARRREHSRQPNKFYQLVEKPCLDISKLEMLARESLDGWNCWSNEADKYNI